MGLTQKLGTIPLAISTDASNNVGIGGSPSGSYKLEVTGTAKVSSTLLVSGPATFSSYLSAEGDVSARSGNYLAAYRSDNTRYLGLFTDNNGCYVSSYIPTSEPLALQSNGTSGRIVFNTATVERMRITGKDVLINTTAIRTSASGANATLNIKGGIYFGDTNSESCTINNNDSMIFNIDADNSSTSNFFRFATNTTLETGGTELMRITEGGVTLFGGTTFTTITSSVLGATNPSFTGRNWSFGPNSSGDYVVYHNQGGGNTGVYLSYGGSSWTSNSDENIKDIIEIIPNALESIKDLRAVKFYWKGDESKKENLGLIAQDVQKSYPELIDKQIFNENEILGVRYTELIPVLVKAIQELSAQNQDLKSRLDKAGL